MTRFWTVSLPAVALLALLAAACGGSGDGSTGGGSGKIEAVITSSDLAVGQQRFAFVILKDGTPVSVQDIAVRFFKIKDEKNPQLVGEGTIPFSPLGVPGLTTSASELTGVYYASVTFDEAGPWGAGFTIGPKSDPATEVRLRFEVKDAPSTVAIGGKAIAVDNPTLANAPLKQIDTSTTPDEAFHRLSIAQALANGKPTVIAFATPAYCETRTCGPAIEIMRAAFAKYGDKVNWVHVEPFKLDANGDLLMSGNERVNSDAANQWRLPSEPWIFVVQGDGTVVARFDGPVSLEEVDFYLAGLTNP